MGAWGHGIFDDDTAMDRVEMVQHVKHPEAFFAEAFDKANSTDYLEYGDCHSVIISAAYMDAMLNETEYVIEGCEDEDYFNKFNKNNISLNLVPLKPDAVSALEVILSEKSELQELWAENEELYPLWKTNVEALMQRLR
ncbi:hypothetical protein BH09BAC1_BH09BAC1_30500 [soil metagenome]